MKKIIVLLALFVAMFAQETYAQQTLTPEQKKEAAKAKREQLMQIRLDLLKEELQLTPEQLAKFDPVYRRYRSEIKRVTSMNKEARTKKANITNENALKVVSARLSNDILTTAVKQRYLYLFAETIEPLQVMKLYRVDSRISREANKILKNRTTTNSGSTTTTNAK